MYPVWDASGKYLWFLASTDLGLRSQWLDMTSYERAADLRPRTSPCCARASRARCCRKATRTPASAPRSEPTPLAPRRTAPVVIDFDGFQQRVVAVPGVSERQYARLGAGVAGTVFFLEAPPVAERGGAPPVHGSTLRRYRLQERTSASFAANVADYAVSADGKKLVYRTPARPAPEGGGEAHGADALPGRRRRQACPTPAPGASTSTLADGARPEGRVPADLQRGLALPARLPVRAQPAGRRLAGDEDRCTARCCRTRRTAPT